jgi:hypothetical protein
MHRLAIVAVLATALATAAAAPAAALSCDNFAPDLQPTCCEFFDGEVCRD